MVQLPGGRAVVWLCVRDCLTWPFSMQGVRGAVSGSAAQRVLPWYSLVLHGNMGSSIRNAWWCTLGALACSPVPAVVWTRSL